MKPERKIYFYKDYFIEFYNALSQGSKKKLDYVLAKLRTEERVVAKFVKSIREGIFELRVEHEGNIYRVFFIFDEGNIVVLFNGFQKKTQKTPSSEIEKAIRIKKEYYADKQQSS